MSENRDGQEYDNPDKVKAAVEYLRATNQGAFADAIEEKLGSSDSSSKSTARSSTSTSSVKSDQK